MKFKSKVDWWFYLLVIILPLILMINLLVTIAGLNATQLIVVVIIFALVMLLPLWLLLRTYYIIKNNSLIIKSGPFKWDIKISEIASVKPSRSLLSSPALSLDRLEIIYEGTKSVLISPINQKEFIKSIGL